MSWRIRKIRLKNFKRFRDYTIEPNPKVNVLVGDNETGKSSILEAIDLAASGDIDRLEAIGVDKLLNVDAVKEFQKKEEEERDFCNLPDLIIELYLEGKDDPSLYGDANMDGIKCHGIRMICQKNQEYQKEINEVLDEDSDCFPYEYYSFNFLTFSDERYTGYRKKLRAVVIDSDSMSSESAVSDFIQQMYLQYTEDDTKERVIHNSIYRLSRSYYCQKIFKDLNTRILANNNRRRGGRSRSIGRNRNYTFGLKGVTTKTLVGDLMIYEDQVSIDNKGAGKQSVLKTELALDRAGKNIDVVLMEEPENHLSPVNLRKLVQDVSETCNGGQLFVTTHSSLISTRLDLNNLLIMQITEPDHPISLRDLDTETATYFMKAPPAGLLEFALSKKVILVEGPSEYMLLPRFYESYTECTPEEHNISIIVVRGLSFKRYLEIAKLTGSKVAVITDNDKQPKRLRMRKYAKFKDYSNIRVFYEKKASKYTFEVALYRVNEELCKRLFKTRKPKKYMLNNKTEAAYKLLIQKEPIVVPGYIKEAIQWIRR